MYIEIKQGYVIEGWEAAYKNARSKLEDLVEESVSLVWMRNQLQGLKFVPCGLLFSHENLWLVLQTIYGVTGIHYFLRKELAIKMLDDCNFAYHDSINLLDDTVIYGEAASQTLTGECCAEIEGVSQIMYDPMADVVSRERYRVFDLEGRELYDYTVKIKVNKHFVLSDDGDVEYAARNWVYLTQNGNLVQFYGMNLLHSAEDTIKGFFQQQNLLGMEFQSIQGVMMNSSLCLRCGKHPS